MPREKKFTAEQIIGKQLQPHFLCFLSPPCLARSATAAAVPWPTACRSRPLTSIRTTKAAGTAATKNTPAKQTAPQWAVRKPLPI